MLSAKMPSRFQRSRRLQRRRGLFVSGLESGGRLGNPALVLLRRRKQGSKGGQERRRRVPWRRCDNRRKIPPLTSRRLRREKGPIVILTVSSRDHVERQHSTPLFVRE